MTRGFAVLCTQTVENNVRKPSLMILKRLNSKGISSHAQNLSTPGEVNAGIVRSLMPSRQATAPARPACDRRGRVVPMFFTNFVEKIVSKKLDLDQSC
jgi:hypothetical protein